MAKFENMTIQEALKSSPVIRTSDLVEIFGCSTRTLCRWQDQKYYANPMPRPFSGGRGVDYSYDSSKLVEWYNTWPLQKGASILAPHSSRSIPNDLPICYMLHAVHSNNCTYHKCPIPSVKRGQA